MSKKKYLTKKEREIYNEAVRDTLKELWLYNGVLPDDNDRKLVCNLIQKKVSYTHPKPIPLNF